MENKNGQGIFYGVIGVATLVVAIIGATFAYFAASVPNNEGTISGNTLNVGGGALTLEVQKVTLGSLNQGLVPAVMAGATGTDAEKLAGLNGAIQANCENAGYTGCHLYEIHVNSANEIPFADLGITLTLTNTDTTNGVNTNWRYAVLTNAANAAASTTNGGTSIGAFTSANVYTFAAGNPAGHNMIINNSSLQAGDSYYYVLVWLADTANAAQNIHGDNTTDERGQYNGVVSLSAGGGEIKATFTAVTPVVDPEQSDPDNGNG